jgi:1,4-dihydroxy-2-naphthoate octaprenyltransferase
MSVSRTGVWLQAFRLHTLPLAVAAIAMGNFMAWADGKLDPVITGLTMLTAISLQILSNLANDYGDTRHGADNPERVGPRRMVQQGMISVDDIKKGVLIFTLISLLSGSFLLIVSLKNIEVFGAMALFVLGILAIAAAIAYTATKNPYGYRALGDLSVFIFFGLISVLGSYFLQTGILTAWVLLPAAGMGLLCTGVLNINNIRDIEADAQANKSTVAVRLGLRKAKVYHWLLLIAATLCFASFMYLRGGSSMRYLFLVPALLFILNAYGVSNSRQPHDINPYLKGLVLSILAFTVIYGIGLYMYSSL